MEQLTKQIYNHILEAMQMKLPLNDPDKAEKDEKQKKEKEARELERLREEHSDRNYSDASYGYQHLNASTVGNNPTISGQHREAANNYLEAAKKHKAVVEAIDRGESIENIRKMSKAAITNSNRVYDDVDADLHNRAGEVGGEASALDAYKAEYKGDRTKHTIKPGFDEVHHALLPEHQAKHLGEWRE